jgi:hypothetical protein
MIHINKLTAIVLVAIGFSVASCNKNDAPADNFDTTGTYTQNDQMGRPAINTVFNDNATDKNSFNTTVPSAMGGLFQSKFQNRLLALNPGYTTNALTQTASQFTTLLANDVLNVKMNGTTTFFDGTNVLTGRALNDDVIDVELLLIFGGPTGGSNPGLTSDNVNANDKPFLSTFPYLAAPF